MNNAFGDAIDGKGGHAAQLVEDALNWTGRIDGFAQRITRSVAYRVRHGDAAFFESVARIVRATRDNRPCPLRDKIRVEVGLLMKRIESENLTASAVQKLLPTKGVAIRTIQRILAEYRGPAKGGRPPGECAKSES